MTKQRDDQPAPLPDDASVHELIYVEANPEPCLIVLWTSEECGLTVEHGHIWQVDGYYITYPPSYAEESEKARTDDAKRELFVRCPQCGGSGAVMIDDDEEDNCDLCAAKGFAPLLDVIEREKAMDGGNHDR